MGRYMQFFLRMHIFIQHKYALALVAIATAHRFICHWQLPLVNLPSWCTDLQAIAQMADGRWHGGMQRFLAATTNHSAATPKCE
jgi:hypothetical protein